MLVFFFLLFFLICTIRPFHCQSMVLFFWEYPKEVKPALMLECIQLYVGGISCPSDFMYDQGCSMPPYMIVAPYGGIDCPADFMSDQGCRKSISVYILKYILYSYIHYSSI